MLIVFFSKNAEMAQKIEQSLNNKVFLDFEFVFSKDPAETIHFLEYSMPQFAIFDLDDTDFSNAKNFEIIAHDHWLSNTGIFGIKEDKTELSAYDFPFFYIFSPSEIVSQMPKILSVLMRNENLLFRAGIIQDIGNKGIFVIQSETEDVKAYAELIASNLSNRGLIQTQKKYAVIFALNEMLINAIEHGNCEITAEEKKAWIASDRKINELVDIKKKDPKIATRVVTLEYELLESKILITITDKGKGFDYESFLKTDLLSVTGYSGRGILMTKCFIDSIQYHPPGNKVSLEISYDTANMKLPVGLEEHKIIDLSAGDILFQKGDKSNGLYFIVRGEFEAWIDGKIVSILDRSDVFIGEMAFLLRHRRTATVKAKTNSQVIFIEAKEWVDTIRKFPMYSVYLSRILARKLNNTSITVSSLKQI
ncbi:MAG TPA: ATP-binding protein [Leptospiraceae bacterium]|nr:ATP-binding protein [Leptospiraceae bacterium]HMW06280.1 ATP-binding protein [Leptospiraceae bacterium]HMX34605.1 ATP-binding protein [Leptospiraceae bacterium]HMY31742.1 ATP-binding protein [Leptospiraceae bacterium]HMZ64535.1 ATP-binding protein [Leptospiraceae bacterium]